MGEKVTSKTEAVEDRISKTFFKSLIIGQVEQTGDLEQTFEIRPFGTLVWKGEDQKHANVPCGVHRRRF